MEEEATGKISFSLSSAPSSRLNPAAAQTSSQPFPHRGSAATISPGGDPGDEAEDGIAKLQFITVFDGSQTLSATSNAKPIVIPPIPDSKGKNFLPVPASDEDYDLWKFREDMKELPQDRGLEEFRDMKVEDFPIAYLAGYGWSKGQVIGRNKLLADPKIVEYGRRRGTEGLGYRDIKGGACNLQQEERSGFEFIEMEGQAL